LAIELPFVPMGIMIQTLLKAKAENAANEPFSRLADVNYHGIKRPPPPFDQWISG